MGCGIIQRKISKCFFRNNTFYIDYLQNVTALLLEQESGKQQSLSAPTFHATRRTSNALASLAKHFFRRDDFGFVISV